ncbi:3385_t:CDS:2, partial [Dentiscutata erythropus]
RTEMAQCLYFDTALVDLTVIGLDDKNEDIDDRFTEDIYDYSMSTLLSSNVGVTNFWISYWNSGVALSKDSNDSEKSEKENNSTIKNPANTKHRGRPATKRFKAATEKPRHQLYTC